MQTHKASDDALMYKREHGIGLAVILVTLLSVAMIGIFLLFGEQQRTVQNRRAQATMLTRTLAQIPFSELSRETKENIVLQLLGAHRLESALAYAVFTDTIGDQVAAYVAPGVIVPEGTIDRGTRSPLMERTVSLSSGAAVFELSSPVSDNDETIGVVRAGFFKPSVIASSAPLLMLVSLTAPIFVLAALLIYSRQRRVKLRGETSESDPKPEMILEPSSELRDFMSRFNTLMDRAESEESLGGSEWSRWNRASRLLTHDSHRIQAALESMPDGVLVMDDAGAATFVNSKVEACTGFASKGMLAKTAASWCDDKKLSILLARYHGNIRPLQGAGRLEYSPSRRPDRIVLASAYPLFAPAESSEILGSLVVFKDVTEDRRAKAARDELISHLAHDLKSPLHTVSMYAELIFDSAAGNVEHLEAAEAIKAQVRRLSDNISDLLHISQIEAGKVAANLKPLDTNEFLRETFARATDDAASKQIETILLLASNLPALNADPDLLRLALSKVVSNAVKYSDGGGTVTLRADEIGESVVVRVSDTGIGISVEDQKRVFDRYFRSEDPRIREQSGAGLGLSLARDIVELHNGRISLESRRGVGTSFIIEMSSRKSQNRAAVI